VIQTSTISSFHFHTFYLSAANTKPKDSTNDNSRFFRHYNSGFVGYDIQNRNLGGVVLFGDILDACFGGAIGYRLKQIDFDATASYSENIKMQFSPIPTKFELCQNYPNPFNPTTKIRYSVPSNVGSRHASTLQLKVNDIFGNEIAVLINKFQHPLDYEITFSAIGGSASGGDAKNLSSGVYFYQLQLGGFIETKKIILLR